MVPNARTRHQLHAHRRVRVDLLQIVDQLRQILDRVDVVMRRRADQRYAGSGMSQPRDEFRYLEARKLAALAGIRALRDLDLDLAAVVQVFRRHAEAAGGNLLDGAVGVVAVRAWLGACRVLPALAGSDFAPIRFMAIDSVSCASGLRAPSEIPGATRRLRISVMLSTPRGDRRHLLGTEVQQIAQRHWRQGAHGFGVALEGLVGISLHRLLQHVDQMAVEGVGLTAAA